MTATAKSTVQPMAGASPAAAAPAKRGRPAYANSDSHTAAARAMRDCEARAISRIRRLLMCRGKHVVTQLTFRDSGIFEGYLACPQAPVRPVSGERKSIPMFKPLRAFIVSVCLLAL